MPTKNATGEIEPGRLPYEPPAIEETSEFETLALNCGFAEGVPSPSCISPPYGNGEPSSG
jgi:hypothetical protein